MKTTRQGLLQTAADAWQVDQVIAFDWYDGPTAGLCRFSEPRFCCYFELIAERWTNGPSGERLFSLVEVEEDAIEQFLAAYGYTKAPNHPCWASQSAPSESTREAADEAIERILLKAIPTRILVQSADMQKISNLWIMMTTEAE